VTVDGEAIDIQLEEPSSERLSLSLPSHLLPRRTWNDTPVRPLQTQVVAFANALFQAAPIVRERRLAAEAAERAREEAQERRRREQRARDRERKRVRLLRSDLLALRRVEFIREYARRLTEVFDGDAAVRRWVSWALNYADSIDPLKLPAARFLEAFPADEGA
jgi:hypothetical protein